MTGARGSSTSSVVPRWVAIVGVVVAGAAVVGWFAYQAASWPAANLDAQVYRGAVRALLAGEDVYAQRFDGLPFTYPPFALLVLLPLAVLPEAMADAAVLTLSLSCTVAVVRMCQSYATRRSGSWSTTLLITAVTCLVVEPVRGTLSLGQVNVVLLALVMALDMRASRWAGAGAGLAAAVKITPALLVVAQAVRGDLRAFLRGTTVVVVAGLLAALVAPSSTAAYFGSLLWDAERAGDLHALTNQSLRGLLARHADGAAAPVWVAAVLTVLAIGAWAVRRHRHDAFHALTAAAVTGLLVSPVAWSHHWVWVLPCVAVGVGAGRRSLLALASYLLLAMTVVPALLWSGDVSPLVGQDLYVVSGFLWLLASAVHPVSGQRPVDRGGALVGEQGVHAAEGA